MEEIKSYFEKLRFDKNHHLGLGDIRLTIAQQGDILSLIEQKMNKDDIGNLLIAWDRFKKDNWWQSDSVDVEAYLLDKFKSIYSMAKNEPNSNQKAHG